VNLDGLNDLFAQPVLLKQMAEGQDRGLIRDPVADQVNARKMAHGGHLHQGLFHGWITEGVPLLLQVDPQHGRQRVGRTPSLLACLWVDGLDQSDQGIPGHNRLHLSQELLALGLLLGGRLLVIREAELLTAHQFSPGLRSHGHSRVDRPVSQSLLRNLQDATLRIGCNIH